MATVNQNMFAASIAAERSRGASLLSLPLNLIALIVSNVDDTGDLARLCQTCRVLNYMALPQLYRDLTLTSYDRIRYRGGHPEGIGSASPFTMGLNAVITRPFATLVQSITLRGDWKDQDLEEHAQLGRVTDSVMLLNITARAAVDRMTNLQSFSWDLNTKMLDIVYSGLTQLPHLTSLTIRFPSTRHPQPTFVLPGMPHLRCLKITNIDPLCYPDDIATMLFKSRKLQDLRLHWSPRMRLAQEPSISLHDYFRKCIAAKQPLAVKKISFQNMFAFHSAEFNDAFDPTTVEDVTFLSGTDNMSLGNKFVEHSWPVAPPHRKLKIKSCRVDAISKRNSEFLENFKGLERLYFVNVTTDSSDYLNSPRPAGTGSTALTPPVTDYAVYNAPTGTTNSPTVASPVNQFNVTLSVRDKYLANIMTHHGASLRHLLLCSKWPLSTSMVARLVHSCPNLEQLALSTEFSSIESLGMLVPFLRRLVALRLLIPAGSPAPQTGPANGSSNRAPNMSFDPPFKIKQLSWAETSIELPKDVEDAISNARSLADLVDMDDQLLMKMMSFDLADKKIFGRLKIVGLGWKAFELRDFYESPLQAKISPQVDSPDVNLDTSTSELNGSDGSAGVVTSTLTSPSLSPALANGADIKHHLSDQTYVGPSLKIRSSILGKHPRDDEVTESRSRPSIPLSDSEPHDLALSGRVCFPPVITESGNVMRRGMRRVGWDVLKHWEIWALDAQEI
ncbi:hypothetical protein N7495_005976 [Penicillium taxi]|uniref:uncharacterized protein n=1 Tax=Penicillium taxi TaxID=168475 RepID=UPI002544E13B|nr:uncharacterized protein N7495_005976 [Penicillium taxi]KAJ5894285.1 hypothetical protein N7495_005976 [Penicillium taxi]